MTRAVTPIAAIVTAGLLAGSALATPTPPAADVSMSPYFVVKGGQAGVDTMPLRSTRADVQISGTIAQVKVTQVYDNSGDDVLEAIYVFPGSTRAAVFGMKMTVGERTIVAEIQKKEAARKIYEEAKREGKSASLLEQQRPNVFQMSVANILPGDKITVEMDYTELLIPTEGVYEFVYPAVVGPRYTGESDSAESWAAQPYTSKGVKASYLWDIGVEINAGLPIRRVRSPSHSLSTELTDSRDAAKIGLRREGDAGTKDFVLRYQLAGEAIESGLLLYPGDDESFFLAMVQPPRKVHKRAMPKREYIFILDVSGSMSGFPLDTAKKVMDGLFAGLRRDDRFNILFFSGGSKLLSEQSLPATEKNLAKAANMLANTDGGGGTHLLAALDRALKLPTPSDCARTFVVVTDGYVTVEPKVFELIRSSLGQANLFAFGIGSSVNRHLINGMARVGMGEPFFVMHDDDAADKAAKFAKYIEAPALTNVKVAFEGFDAYDVEPAAVPDLFASRPVVVFGKYRGQATGAIKVSGLTGRGAYAKTLQVGDYTPDQGNTALRYLWARHKIAALADLNRLRKDDRRVAQVTALGLKYNLMTAYTSFVAVDQRVRNYSGEFATVKQPLPLPQGVANAAIGGHPPSIARPSAPRGGAMRAKQAKAVLRPPTRPRRPVTDRATAETELAAPTSTKRERKVHGKLVGTTVVGAHAKAAIDGALKRYLKTLALCGDRVGATGAVIVSLTIDAKGKVIAVKLIRDDAGRGVGKCILSNIKRARFPESTGQTTVRAVVELWN